jgi:hypothetical protein
MPLAGVPLWIDQAIELYHGTLETHVDSVLGGIDLNVCRDLTDFGRGFYTTTNRLQAEQWATNLANRTGGVPAVIRFTVERDGLAHLEGLFFIRGSAASIDYWSFVQYCKTVVGDHRRTYTGWYDIVAGPVVGSLKKQTVLPDADQVSFHTPRAVRVLDDSTKARVL